MARLPGSPSDPPPSPRPRLCLFSARDTGEDLHTYFFFKWMLRIRTQDLRVAWQVLCQLNHEASPQSPNDDFKTEEQICNVSPSKMRKHQAIGGVHSLCARSHGMAFATTALGARRQHPIPQRRKQADCLLQAAGSHNRTVAKPTHGCQKTRSGQLLYFVFPFGNKEIKSNYLINARHQARPVMGTLE